MPLPTAYHRPATLNQALALLAEPKRVPLAGGTVLNADREPSDIEVVDLQALGLDQISAAGDSLRIGSTVTLDELARHEAVPAWLAEIARAEAASTLRTLATVGGLAASRWGDSVLLAALLASDATVELAGPAGTAPADALETPLAALLEDGVPAGALIVSFTFDISGDCATAATGRTPADVPIVAAVARSLSSPEAAATIRLALSGVAAVPRLVDPEDPTAGLEPLGDFRGSSGYRLQLASVLSRRVLGGLT